MVPGSWLVCIAPLTGNERASIELKRAVQFKHLTDCPRENEGLTSNFKYLLSVFNGAIDRGAELILLLLPALRLSQARHRLARALTSLCFCSPADLLAWAAY